MKKYTGRFFSYKNIIILYTYMDIIIGTLGGILVAHFTSNRDSQYGGNANEDVLDQLHGLGRRKELRRGVQGKTCYNVLELNDVDIANYLRENKDHFVIHLGGKKYDACNSLENMRDTYSFEADGKKRFKVWYACNNNDGRLGPQNIDRSVEYVNMTQTFSTFVEKPKWVYRGSVPEPRVFHLQKNGERKGMISNHILDFNDSHFSGDHCNQINPVSIYRLVAGHKNTATNSESNMKRHLIHKLNLLLIKAAKEGNTAIVERILAVDGVDVNAKDKNGVTALFVAAKDGHTEIAKLLLAVPGIDVNAKDRFERTALIRAAEEVHTEIVKLLLAVDGVDVNAKNNEGETALICAANFGRTEIAKLLLAVPGIDVNAKDRFERTALIRAAEEVHTEIVKLLLAVPGIDVNAKDMDGETALLCAVLRDRTEIAKLLLAVDGVDVNAKDKNGKTALIMVAEEGHTEIVKLLLAVDGVDVNAKDKDGRTALRIAAKEGHTEIVEQLLDVPGIYKNISV